MFEVDKRGGDYKRNEHPVGDRHLPWENFPDRQKEQSRQQFDSEVTETDRAPAISTAASQK